MELFIPSLLLIVLAGFVVFAVLPKAAPFVLAFITVILLAAVGYQHYVIFKDEYAQSTWQESIKNASMPFLIGITVLFMLGFALNFVRSGVRNTPTTPLPSYSQYKSAFPSVPRFGMNRTTSEVKSLIRNP
jgi:sensor histidine kinase YesM